jgi:hypothetical protein
MLFAMIAVLALSASPTPSATAPPATPAPLRHVEYKVSYHRERQLAIGTYGGNVAQSDSKMPTVSGGTPSENDAATKDQGTIWIDVLGIRDDVLYVRITEKLDSRGAPFSVNATVDPAGLLAFSNQGYSPVTRYLLPFFARNFGSTATFAPGATWNDDIKTPQVTVTTKYTVEQPEGAAFWLNELQLVKVNAAQGMDLTTQGRVLYNHALLVPLKGDLEEYGARKTMDSEDKMTTKVHFERTADSFDQGPAAPATPATK